MLPVMNNINSPRKTMSVTFICSWLVLIGCASFSFANPSEADDTSSDTGITAKATYLANEGLMVVQGDTKILFDPLFRNGYGSYQMLPESMEKALYAGEAPFDGVDAVFISHHHGDHFSPADILKLLIEQPDIRLYAPAQAVLALKVVDKDQNEAVFERVTAVDLNYRDEPVTLKMESLLIEAVRIPHSGWPTGRLDVENISWRVTLNTNTTVLHMGDADPNDTHFRRDVEYWDKAHVNMAFPPYWFFDSRDGLLILRKRIKADHEVGVHVPVIMPSDPARRPPKFREKDLFTKPGEARAMQIFVPADTTAHTPASVDQGGEDQDNE